MNTTISTALRATAVTLALTGLVYPLAVWAVAQAAFPRQANGSLVVDETSGSWGTVTEVPGSASLNANGNAGVTSVSCATAGNCAAGGFYFDALDQY